MTHMYPPPHMTQELEAPPSVRTRLLLHQRKALHWMVAREEPSKPLFWEPYFNSRTNTRGWFNTVTRAFSRSPPQGARGGMLADEMGLGKTLTVISRVMRPYVYTHTHTRTHTRTHTHTHAHTLTYIYIGYLASDEGGCRAPQTARGGRGTDEQRHRAHPHRLSPLCTADMGRSTTGTHRWVSFAHYLVYL